MGHVTTHLRVAAVLVALVLAVAGCTTPRTQPNPPSGPGQAPAQGGAPLGTTLRIVAGSEHRSVLDQVVVPWCEQHRYDCQYTLMGSVDQARLLTAGGGEFEAYWFASSVFAQLGNTSGQLTDVQPMFLTPIVYAGWKSEMERLGFGPGADVTVQQVLDAVEGGQTKVWATNPTQSNSGATMYFAFLNHFAGNGPGQALTAEQLASAPVKDGISRFVRAMDRTPPSTGTMMRECLEAAPGQCQTLFTYEDLVIESNHELEAAGREPLTVAYPRGALAISDAPLGFFPRSDADNDHRRKVFTELQSFLLTDPGAREALTKLGRRPADSVGLTLTDPDLGVFNPAWGIRTDVREQAIVFPAAPVIQQALDDYHGTFRQAASVYYCLDGSGSMSGAGWDGVKAAAAEIFDPERARVNLLQTAPDDATTVTIFNSGITRGPETIEGNADADLLRLKALVDGYRPGGGTNMYTCLTEAVRAQASDSRKKIIVLMTDGQSTDGGRRQATEAATRPDDPAGGELGGVQDDRGTGARALPRADHLLRPPADRAQPQSPPAHRRAQRRRAAEARVGGLRVPLGAQRRPQRRRPVPRPAPGAARPRDARPQRRGHPRPARLPEGPHPLPVTAGPRP